VSLVTPIENGGCLHIDLAGDWWIEEYITNPPTHILNGFIWALWGARDYVSAQKPEARGQRSEVRSQKSELSATEPTKNQERRTRNQEPAASAARSEQLSNATTQQLNNSVRGIWDRSLTTLEHNLESFDTGYWSLYDVAPVGLRNVASPFYHRLHIVQMDVMWRLTGKECFRACRDRWAGYAARPWNRGRALARKALFKMLYY